MPGSDEKMMLEAEQRSSWLCTSSETLLEEKKEVEVGLAKPQENADRRIAPILGGVVIIISKEF